jgi:hypothetical protein
MADFDIEFQEIHKRATRRISAPDMYAAIERADEMLPEIVRQRGWLKAHAFVGTISPVRQSPQETASE